MKLLISGTVLLRLVRAVFVAKLLISGILFATVAHAVFVAAVNAFLLLNYQLQEFYFLFQLF